MLQGWKREQNEVVFGPHDLPTQQKKRDGWFQSKGILSRPPVPGYSVGSLYVELYFYKLSYLDFYFIPYKRRQKACIKYSIFSL